MSETVAHLITKKIIYIPVNGVLYRRTIILEKMIPLIDLTGEEENETFYIYTPPGPMTPEGSEHDNSNEWRGQNVHK